MTDLERALYAATVVLNLALAVAIGAGATSLSLAGARSAWAARQLRAVHRVGLAALPVAMLASAAGLWFRSATLAEVPLLQAGAFVRTMVTATHLGLAWQIGIGALVLGTVAMACASRTKLAVVLSLLAVALFLYTRSMVSHAAADGDASWPMLADWIHSMMACLWVGEVCVAAFVIRPPGAASDDRDNGAAYIATLSTTATFALAAIVVTGSFSAWHNLDGIGTLVGNPYGTTLLVKLALVAAAAALGGYNRFIVMPPLLAGLRSADARRFTKVLRVESAVLVAVLLLAAILSSTSQPNININ